MGVASPNLSVPIRNAVINSTAISDIPAYLDTQAVFTSPPIPEDTPFPCVIISSEISKHDMGSLLGRVFLRLVRQVSVIGLRKSVPDQLDAIEACAIGICDLFHRKPSSLTVTNWRVLNIWATGPIVAPQADDSKFTGRIVTLNIDLVAGSDI